jgi:hypothetical protein
MLERGQVECLLGAPIKGALPGFTRLKGPTEDKHFSCLAAKKKPSDYGQSLANRTKPGPSFQL